MAKSLQSHPLTSAPPRPSSTAQIIHRNQGYTWWPAALLAGLVLIGFWALVYGRLPRELPVWTQRFLGLLNAFLAWLVFVLATHRSHHLDPKTLALRLQQRHHAGTPVPASPKQHSRMVRIPLLGETSLRALGGTAIFVGVLLWWLTPLAPIRVRAQGWENLGGPLGHEIESVILVLADSELPVPHPPIRPAAAKAMAASIPATAERYLRGQRATALGLYEEAQSLLNLALSDGKHKPEEIRLALGQNALFASHFAEAAQHYDQLLRGFPSDPEIWCQGAVAWLHKGDYVRAEELARKAVSLAEAPKAPSNPRVLAVCRHVQAAVAICHGKEFGKIDQWNRQAQETLGNLPTEMSAYAASLNNQSAYAASLNNQAVFFTLLGKYPGAQNNFNFALSTWQKGLGSQHPYLAASRSNLALLHYITGRYADAQRLAEDVRRLRDEFLSPSHPAHAMGLHLTALLECATREDREGLPQARQALQRLEESYSPQHPQVAAALGCVGAHYQGLSRYRRAESYYYRMAQVCREVLPPQHPYLSLCLYHLGQLYQEEGRFDEARSRAEAALKLDEKLLGPNHPAVARDLVLLAQILIQSEQPGNVRGMLERAQTIHAATLPEQHPEVALTLATLAALEGNNGVARYQAALAMAGPLLGENHPQMAQFRYDLARCYMKQGQFAEAKEQVRRCLAICQTSLVPYHPKQADALDLSAEILRRSDPAAQKEAEALEKQAEQIRMSHEEVNTNDTQSTSDE